MMTQTERGFGEQSIGMQGEIPGQCETDLACIAGRQRRFAGHRAHRLMIGIHPKTIVIPAFRRQVPLADKNLPVLNGCLSPRQ